ncbi:MAG TPA: GMC oxidoreductase, partial [Candidatus Acidoferrales bacterium]|nr:GMC oxidoreductase [Candidatus Acidoferrales bacterium]
YVHGQITTLKTAMLHPIAANLPCDLRTAAFLVNNMHAALGIVNVNLHDTRRQGNFVSLAMEKDAQDSRLVINYSPEPAEVHRLRNAINTVRRALLHLGCVVPPGMLHVRPMGASVHYAGTLPMSRTPGRHTTSETCQSHEFPNLFLVDGATFPFLPAKNITFSLMANAVRIADRAF